MRKFFFLTVYLELITNNKITEIQTEIEVLVMINYKKILQLILKMHGLKNEHGKYHLSMIIN